MRGLALVALALAAAAAIAVAIWLAAPLVVDERGDEAFPVPAGAPAGIQRAETATVPETITRAEVEGVMAGLAKIDQPVDETMPDGPTALAAGRFEDADSFHRGEGQATIYRLGDGRRILRLSDFRVTNGPDLHVLLTGASAPETREDLDAAGYVDLGDLKGNIGNQNYPVPDEVDVSSGGSVVIYCMPFHVVFSVARLDAAP